MNLLCKLSSLILLMVAQAFVVPTVAADLEVEEMKEYHLPEQPLTRQEWRCTARAIIDQIPSGLCLNLADLIADYSFEAPLKIAAGFYHFSVMYDGQIYTWDSSVLTLCAQPLADYVTKVAAGCEHNLAYTKQGELYAWGSNLSGELGDGSQDRAITPIKTPIKLNIDQLQAGLCSSMLLTQAGQILVWGGHAENTFNLIPQPFDLPLESNDRVIKIAAHANLSMALTKNGKVFTWGKFLHLQEKLIKGVIQIAVSTMFFSVLTEKGQVWTWGRHYNSQVGTLSEQILEPVLVDIQDFIVDIAAGHYHALGLTNDGQVYSWGNNERAQRGLDDTKNHLQPTLVPLQHRIKNITASENHSVASTEDAKIFTWGSYPRKNSSTHKIFPSPIQVLLPDISPSGPAS